MENFSSFVSAFSAPVTHSEAARTPVTRTIASVDGYLSTAQSGSVKDQVNNVLL